MSDELGRTRLDLQVRARVLFNPYHSNTDPLTECSRTGLCFPTPQVEMGKPDASNNVTMTMTQDVIYVRLCAEDFDYERGGAILQAILDGEPMIIGMFPAVPHILVQMHGEELHYPLAEMVDDLRYMD